MPAVFLRAIGRFIFPFQLVHVEPKMGQSPSLPSDKEPSQASCLGKRLGYRDIQSTVRECQFTHRNWVLPELLENIVTAENVNASINFKSPSVCNGEYASRVVENAPKTFAVLLWIGQPQVIEDLLLEGFTDAHLPLSRAETDGHLLYGKGGKTFWAFSNIEDNDEGDKRDRIIDSFLDRQWAVLTPVFDDAINADQDTLIHKIHPKCALPLSNKKHITKTGMSIVSSCELHPYHYQDRGKKVSELPIRVAVKELGEDDETFERETQSLFRIRQFDNPHLIRHIAACKVETPYPKYYVIFPLASDGDLHAYWKNQDKQPRTPGLIRWSLEQMLGLASGLQDLHRSFPNGSNCRHGDLKPLNILLFDESGTKRLVIADFGIAKIHSKMTAVRTQKETDTRATTKAYEAPEAHKKCKYSLLPRPRVYDVWSLGCILLEFTIWLLYGLEAVEGFASWRPNTWTESRPGGFYAIKDDGSPVVSEMVIIAMAQLLKHERCGEGTALGRLVRLIQTEMLVAESKRRSDAPRLVEELGRIVGDVVQGGDESLWSTELELASPGIPEVFRLLGNGVGAGFATQ
ncbi:kinase-like domain-containing protein [Echria macrotheca]|uniref:Kinase-like domain-containing protein n=1 Tax=Echria macrotheca TaxID=438768 RepID=A0AAJ0B3W3_9PEZI|nr:kinase-like domain-containing protein [Echria macrotheca]